MDKCVFAGTFDPITNGHLHVISKCAMMFEKVFVLLAVNAQKKALFPMEKRLELVKKCCKNMPNVTVQFYGGYIADFMRENDVTYYVRGVRDQKDVDYEEKCFKVTLSLNPNAELMIFQAPKSLLNTSSTVVRELLAKGKSVAKYVPSEIIDDLETK